MLAELTVRNLGVIDELTLLLGPGLTALTGETGAGKTMLVEAVDLLVGGRSDAVLVRPGATEAEVSGRFIAADGEEVVLARVVPAEGRSRAYVDGRMATVSALAEAGRHLVDLHGQHSHQSLLSPAVQRSSLDRFGAIDASELAGAVSERRRIDDALAALGGDGRARAREVELLRFQLSELDSAGLSDPDEEIALEAEEDALADVLAHQEAAGAAYESLGGEGGAADAASSALQRLQGRGPFAAIATRLQSVTAELRDLAAEIRVAGESLEDDPERLASVRARRQLLADLKRKYGETLADVLSFRIEVADRLADLEGFEERARELESAREQAVARVDRKAHQLGEARRAAAPRLALAIESHLRTLAMTRARFAVTVGDDPGDDVVFGLGANPGEPVLPLVKVASGGELARTMLAARLVLTGGPATLVFDEVDAGIGGEAALAVGQALAGLASAAARQVLVVTHLPQVAAFAENQVVVRKRVSGGRTRATANHVAGEPRLVELGRMLSGQPDSETARRHAAELLDLAERRAVTPRR